MATVTACKYDAGAGRAMAFGLPTSKHFRISFNYWAPNAEGTPELHTGEFSSENAIPQNTLFPIHYDPTSPHQHSQSSVEPVSRRTLLTIGIIGSIALSAAWLFILRGCR
jgi:hypothetical protein